MSIFRETFPTFVSASLSERQTGMLTRDPKFIQQLNTRSSWVRMTSGVNYENSNTLAKQYVLQGGTLNNDNLRVGLNSDGTGAYDRLSPGGNPQRLGIRPMPGITDVSIQSKGAYGSLQEATVSFKCWDIKQLEDLELLYMRPGYTVLLEFGWNFAKDKSYYGIIPRYDILNIEGGISLNDAFKEIYNIIIKSKGTYDALLGYVKNYNWSARDDGGYDCTTTIISLGEVLESLKCNWIPIATTAFNVGSTGLLKQNLSTYGPQIKESYEQGIIPGLLHELWGYMNDKANEPNEALTLIDLTHNTPYNLYISKNMKNQSKNDRGGLVKPLGKDNNTEGWITLGSFCDLINNYVLLKDKQNQPLAQIVTYQTDYTGSIIYENNKPKSLECIASSLSISTNLGVCLLRNDNWASLNIKQSRNAAQTDKTGPTTISDLPPIAIQNSIRRADFNEIGLKLIGPKITKSNITKGANIFKIYSTYTYEGFLENDLKLIASDLLKGITKIELIKDSNNQLITQFLFFNNSKFTSTNYFQSVNFFDYFFKTGDSSVRLENAYNSLFKYEGQNPFENNVILEEKIFVDSSSTHWDKNTILQKIKDIFSQYPLNEKLLAQAKAQTSIAASDIAIEAANTPGLTKDTLPFLIPNNSINSKTLGRISNIYVNINFLYSQAVSKNIASNDHQNKNNISVREYIQGILREIQNSIGNINNFDLQVDNKNAIGRIIDINFTGDTSITPFLLQIHNLGSIVRKYNFQSKIFPEMGSIIAISAQDATGIGRLGYDNATLVAWNEGITDRLVPKKSFSSSIQTSKEEDPTSFILPFLTKLHNYFQSIQGQNPNNVNFAYGGLNFAYRDFLANLNQFDPRNNFKTIIPTELSITLDGIGGMVIGNLFKINQDIVPKGYRNVSGRKLAYIITKLGHELSDNDWTTTISAYPIIFENSIGVDIIKSWNENQYPGSVTILIGDTPIARVSPPIDTNIKQAYDRAEIIEPGFKEKVKKVAANIGVDELDLVKVMYKETKGTFNPSITNNNGCTGLIQFCPDTSQGNVKVIGGKLYYLSNVKQMSRIQQMDVVEAYFKSFGFNNTTSRTLTDLYLVTFYPAAIGKPGNYVIGSESINPEWKFKIAKQNPGISAGKEVITVNDIIKWINS